MMLYGSDSVTYADRCSLTGGFEVMGLSLAAVFLFVCSADRLSRLSVLLPLVTDSLHSQERGR